MLERSYSTERRQDVRIVLAPGARARLGGILAASLPPPRQVAVLTDRNVASFHLDAVVESLRAAGYAVSSLKVPAGEESKSLRVLGHVWDRLLASALERDSILVGLGGGMVGDLAGFAASTLLRGLSLVQVPTTLLAQVDASLGGKTAINRSAGKNLVGTFWQPALVLVDVETLATLPRRELRSGLAEVIKYGMIRRPGLLAQLEGLAGPSDLEDPALLADVILECVEAKVEILAADPFEQGARAELNYGHTIGHALEAAESFRGLLHGEAVAVGMVGACHLAVELGLAEAELPERLAALLRRFGLPTATPLGEDALLPRLALDKKRRGGRLRWVLVERPGTVSLRGDVPEEPVRRALAAIRAASEEVAPAPE